MSAFREIVNEVRGLADWQVRLFALGCAHRVGPLAPACGSAGTAALYQEALAALRSAEQGAPNASALLATWRGLRRWPRSTRSTEYWAKLPVVILTMVLRAGTADDPGEVGRRACGLALELHDSVDHALLSLVR